MARWPGESCQREESCHDQVCHRACDCDVPVFGVHGPGAGLSRPRARQCDGRKQGRAARRHGHADATTRPASPSRASPTADGRYLSTSSIPASTRSPPSSQGFKKREQRNVRVQQRGDVTADLTLAVGGIEETVIVEAPPVTVQFNTSSSDLTLERQLIDQVPITGRNPYNLANLDPDDHARRSATRTGRTTTPTPTTTTPAAARGAPMTCCSTACRSAPATRRPTRRRWTRSRKSPSRRTAWTRRTATASAASSA